jgi:DNA-binding IclR family transcriptional regulator
VPAGQAGSGEGAQTLDRGLAILGLLATSARTPTVAQIASELDISRPIVYRLLNSLMARDLVARTVDGTGFRLSYGVLDLARGVSGDLQDSAAPVMLDLSEEFDATALLVVANGEEAVCLATREPKGPHIRLVYPPGFRHPLHLTASGMAILAGRPPANGERKEITAARRRGWAESFGDIQPVSGVGIAAPISKAGAPAEASIGIASLDTELRTSEVGPKVVEAAQRIGAQLL